MTPPFPRTTQALGGRQAALRALLDELLPRVRNLVRYLVRSDEEVDDLAREALVAIARSPPARRGEGALWGWADRVTLRVVLRRVRSDQWRARADDAGGLAVIADAEGSEDGYAERRRAVALLDRLPTAERHALVMHQVVGLSVEEIARELELSRETVSGRLRAGLALLCSLDDWVP